jgi:hypothetical protein
MNGNENSKKSARRRDEAAARRGQARRSPVQFESLEGRQMMSATPLAGGYGPHQPLSVSGAGSCIHIFLED